MNRYIDRDEIDLNQLKEFNISVRGSLDKHNIYFNLLDIQNAFDLPFNRIKHTQEILWISTDDNRERYITYNDLTNQSQNGTNEKLNEYISLLDQLLDTDETMSDWSEWSDIDDKSLLSCPNDHSEEINHYMIIAYQYKIELLMQIIETKNKELLIKDKEIEIINMKIDRDIKEKNNIMLDLLKHIEHLSFSKAIEPKDTEYQSEWI